MCCVNWKTKAFFPSEGIINGVSAAIDDVVRHLRAAGTLRQQSVACWLRSIIISSHSSTICRQHRQTGSVFFHYGEVGKFFEYRRVLPFHGKNNDLCKLDRILIKSGSTASPEWSNSARTFSLSGNDYSMNSELSLYKRFVPVEEREATSTIIFNRAWILIRFICQ